MVSSKQLLLALVVLYAVYLFILTTDTLVPRFDRNENNNNNNNSDENKKQRNDAKSFGMCIMGQLTRLELQSKIDQLFKPLHMHFGTVDVVLVLAPGEAQFVNNDFRGSATLGHYRNTDEAVAELQPFTSKVRVVSVKQPQNPVLNPPYLERLDNGFEAEALLARGRAHVRQWSMYIECLFGLMDLETENGKWFDYMGRIREDLIVLRPVQLAVIQRALDSTRHTGMTVVTSGCDTWKGINDKIAFVTRKAAKTYFTTPLKEYYLTPEDTLKQPKLKNPETFLKFAFRRNKLTVVALPATALHVMPERVRDDGSSCIKMLTSHCHTKDASPEYIEYLNKLRCT